MTITILKLNSNLLFLYILLFFIIKCDCTRRIGQGIAIDDATRFPYFAQLQRPIPHRPNHTRKCGGTLIHPQWILTAGHCFPEEKRYIIWMLNQNIDMVLMGSSKSYNRNYSTTNTFVGIYHHPKYRPIRVYDGLIAEYDVALGQLRIPYEITPTIQTIRLASSFGICTNGIMIGVGRTNLNNPNSKSNHVKYAEMTIKPSSEIKYKFYRTPTTFYTDAEIDNKYTGGGYPLPGDSGGPFVCTISKQPVQIGIFSGGGPTNKTVFSIYERVDKHLDFIFTYVPDINYVRALSMGLNGMPKKYTVSKAVLLFCIFIVFVLKSELQ